MASSRGDRSDSFSSHDLGRHRSPGNNNKKSPFGGNLKFLDIFLCASLASYIFHLQINQVDIKPLCIPGLGPMFSLTLNYQLSRHPLIGFCHLVSSQGLEGAHTLQFTSGDL